eukprot:CAMPEP_0177778088 /NCGR_PEP_ID=MMETSP0491_2-20121128/15757_1 /TAXON_ID=63592 /ORGANISM="Tetraselmis chuii, Strain PLY429" /LENGTH=273 /DNA_ID=CAMNT_0019297317 /DNA_START=223 /DNA_END=1041 /DNA_ORIENTATION=+
MASDGTTARRRVLTYASALLGATLACVALFHAVSRTEVPGRVVASMKRGSSALLPLGQLVGGRKVVKLPSGVDTRRIGRFPQLQRDPPPRDGVMYRSAGDGDHVVSHLPHRPNEDTVRDAAIAVIPRVGGWDVVVAWIAAINGADLLMFSTIGADGFSWQQHKPIVTLGGLSVDNLKWSVDETLKRKILMFNARTRKHPDIMSVNWIHTFPGFVEAKKKHAGWSHIQDMPSLKGCLLSSPPLRGLKSGLVMPVHELESDTDLLKWSLAEDGKE